MMVIDTNVLVDAANKNSEFHRPCLQLLDRSRAQASPWFMTWPICYEFLRVATHPTVFSRAWSIAGAWQFLEALLQAPSTHLLIATERHRAVLAEVIDEMPHLRGSFLHDVHTAVLMREHGIREIYTRDSDFSRFRFLRVIDPLA